ncbi:hypothetical protein NDU88_004653 [Pleurodeles waltl]|uniref:Uncharacterized protein n=1 Tax=Pleurodeles waltl TaxID=8319 RepID=A0AAV7WX90_PLEWA|nr:hypothetical protein NDU88_004653 [Pleurodeles waltl]
MKRRQALTQPTLVLGRLKERDTPPYDILECVRRLCLANIIPLEAAGSAVGEGARKEGLRTAGEGRVTSVVIKKEQMEKRQPGGESHGSSAECTSEPRQAAPQHSHYGD